MGIYVSLFSDNHFLQFQRKFSFFYPDITENGRK